MNIKFGAFLPKSLGPFSNNPEIREKYGWEKEKLGNPNPVIFHTGSVLLNSMALPTHPIETWIEEFENSKIVLVIEKYLKQIGERKLLQKAIYEGNIGKNEKTEQN
jgi:hypothetical protein